MSTQFVRVQNCQLELHENSAKIDDIAITLVGKKPTLLLRYLQHDKREYKVPSFTYHLAASCYQHLLIEYVLVMCYQSRAVHFDVRPPLISIRTPETLLQKCESTMQCQHNSRRCLYSQTVGLYVYALIGCCMVCKTNDIVIAQASVQTTNCQQQVGPYKQDSIVEQSLRSHSVYHQILVS